MINDADAIIKKLSHYTTDLFDVRDPNGIKPLPPDTLAKNLLIIRGLLLDLVDVQAEIERDYRLSKAARFDKFITEGMKRSPAQDQLDMEQDLIDKKINTERVRNYMKFCDGLCTSVQSVLRIQAGSDKNQY